MTLWNPIASQVAGAKMLSISQSARLFALVNVAAADAALTSLFGDKPGVPMVAHSPAHPAFDHLWFRFSQG